ncbi:hypothetical protein CANMA_003855 [Candida margitis]|uniref:uncharacterized protein n=1 Tax=Candida margitis TaxID=1775924 RepID=UPI002227FEF8|nr:uncharacterized protein CANMA_003855 [Candida margitis]KAI5961081.1 hypothetical protein CANMA_003855 [Candida margitis]
MRISRRLIREEVENLGKSTHFLPVQYDVPKRIIQQENGSSLSATADGLTPSTSLSGSENFTTPTPTPPISTTSNSDAFAPPQPHQQNHLLSNGPAIVHSHAHSHSHSNPPLHPHTQEQAKRSLLNIESLIHNNHNEDHLDFLNGTDLNMLTNDLSNLVSEIMEFQNIPFQEDFQFDFFNEVSHNHEEYIVNVPIDYIKLKRKHEILYLEQFYNNFANIIEPFSAYHSQTKITSNPARDVILKTASSEPCLLAAVLAEGAKTSFMKYKQPEDEKAYGAYLTKCLKLLEPAKEITNINANIEGVLLTLLLLTAATATSTQQWRPHLTGCKDLLLKISTTNVANISKVFVFCKYWFLSIEILAGLSTNIGGTLQTDYEIDHLMSCGTDHEIGILCELGIITDQGFNNLMGFHNTCISCFRDLLKLLNRYRINGSSSSSIADIMQNIKILSDFHQQAAIIYIDSKGVIPESELHKYTPGLPIEEIRIGEQRFWLSWQDISHQSFVLSSIIMILTRFFQMGPNNPNVAQIVDKIVSFIYYLHNFSDVQQHASPFLLLMIQWPLLVTGLHATREEQQLLLLKYFAMVGQIGAATANVSVKMLKKQWKGTSSFEAGDTLIY